MDRSTDQIEHDIAQTRADIDQSVGALETQARSQVSRMRSSLMAAAAAGALGLLVVGAIRRLRR